MVQHSFIFCPGTWLSEGKLQLNMLEDELVFFARWHVKERDGQGCIECTQEIQVRGLSDIMVNHFLFSDITPSSFAVTMDNHAVGKVSGIGTSQEDVVGWEFRVPEIGFEGFEFYKKQSDELYHVRGEFATMDDLRTIIYGKVWRSKNKESNDV